VEPSSLSVSSRCKTHNDASFCGFDESFLSIPASASFGGECGSDAEPHRFPLRPTPLSPPPLFSPTVFFCAIIISPGRISARLMRKGYAREAALLGESAVREFPASSPIIRRYLSSKERGESGINAPRVIAMEAPRPRAC
jgi:hypothetical protein